VVYVFCINTAAAQTIKAYPVKVGEIPKEVLPNEAMYVLPAFTGGIAWFRNGTSSTQRFNYNFLLDEMHFIDAGGDTLAIAEPALIKSVVIDSMVFYYDNGYLREIFKAGIYKLAVKQEMMQVADKTRGGYDAASGASSIKTYGSINNNNSKIYQLQVNKDVLFKGVISFYIGNAFNPFLKATRKNFHILFAEKDVTKYIKEQKINFNKEEDIKALLQFCAQ
jgi:2-hydroxy-3-keto-5-methylthiopentenyl-1-phosphate phosphatase